jgi:hypothetical protein
VANIVFAGGEAVIIDESGPDYLLREVNPGTGQMRPLGHIPPGDLEVSIGWAAPVDWVGSSGLYAVAGRYDVPPALAPGHHAPAHTSWRSHYCHTLPTNLNKCTEQQYFVYLFEK